VTGLTSTNARSHPGSVAGSTKMLLNSDSGYSSAWVSRARHREICPGFTSPGFRWSATLATPDNVLDRQY
jgi:hypothetical protein